MFRVTDKQTERMLIDSILRWATLSELTSMQKQTWDCQVDLH